MIRSRKRSMALHDLLTIFPSTLTLAFWRLRRSLWLLFVMGIGIAAAVMLVCAVPLYSDVAMSAGLRAAVTGAPQGADIIVSSSAENISSSAIDSNSQQLDSIMHNNLGSFLAGSQFTIQTQALNLLVNRTDRSGKTVQVASSDQFQLVGFTMSQTASHVKLLKGRLPVDGGKDVEVALTQDNATQLKASPGSVVTVNVDFINGSSQTLSQPLQLHVVGIFKPVQANDPFFHNREFSFQEVGHGATNPPTALYTGLVSQQTLIASLTAICNMQKFQNINFSLSSFMIWYYQLDVSRMSVDNLDQLLSDVNAVQAETSDVLDQAPYIEQTQTVLPSDVLQQYEGRVGVAQTIVVSLLVLVVALVLFFVSMMADVLVDGQADAIAVLRSRGASASQVVGALMVQSLILSVLALLAGPLLAIVLVRYMVMRLLPASNQGALNLISSNPVQVVQGLGWYALAAVGVVVLAMIIAFVRISRVDVLTARREAARATRRPLWQRLNLDVLAIIVALTGFGISTYITDANVLDAGQRLLLLSPLTLMKSVFLLIAAVLLFLRFFLPLLRLGAWVATRNRGAAPMLALAQMSRTPSQSVRMTLLLSLAITFSIFTLIFSASQSQRILDVAAYQGGADFSGLLGDLYSQSSAANLTQLQNQYRHIKGVQSTTFGYTASASAASSAVYMSIEFRAVDANTFAQTAIWPDQNSTQSLTSLMRQLALQRGPLLKQLKPPANPKVPTKLPNVAIPAIVDALTWKNLHLSQGAPFSLSFLAGDAKFVAIAEVQHIPTVNDSTEPSSGDYSPPGGVLVDYQTYSAYAQRLFPNDAKDGVHFNYVWEKSYDDAASVASVRNALTHGKLRLATLYDRRAVIDSLHVEPLYLTLIGVLTLEVVTALFLALVGALIASWLNVRKRLANFALLRALGTAPHQLASVLTWEQCIVYVTAIGLGVLFGGLLSTYVLPSMILTNIPPGGVGHSIGNVATADFYILQTVPPVRIVVPNTLAIALGVLVVVCFVVLGMMVRIVSKPSIAQTLRLNED